jgi:two-component system sensor histidine kinase DegS
VPLKLAYNMKQNQTGLSQQYVMALGKNLKQGSRASLKPALELGRQAAILGLETLDLARMHERALATLKLSNVKNAFTKLAGIFFSEANTAIEEKKRAARENKVTEEGSVKDRKCHDKCLEESLELQKCLRQLTHRVLAAQEDERKKLSHELQDEIAQILLGINVRLLSLKQGARNNTKGLKKEIASAQRLVVKSAKSVRRFARELDFHRPASSERPVSTI